MKTLYALLFTSCLLCLTPLPVAALTCPAPSTGVDTATCDCLDDLGMPIVECDVEANYQPGGGKLCLVEPPDGYNIGQNSLCVLGKFKTFADVQSLADFVAAVSLPDNPEGIEDVVDPVPLDTISEDGGFSISLPIAEPGVYQAIVGVDFYTGGPNPVQKEKIVREVIRLESPDFAVTEVKEEDAKTGTPTEEITTPPPEGEEEADRRYRVEGSFSSGSLDLCLQPVDGTWASGTDLTFTATNEVTDPTESKVITNTTVIETTSISLQPSGASFCGGGISLAVPMGHGENRIALEVDNALTVNGTGERITLEPIQNDIRGPALTVQYLDEDGKLVPVDGKFLPASLAPSFVTIDITSPEPLFVRRSRGMKSSICDDTAAVCIQFNNTVAEDGSALFVPMEEKTIGGETHYQARFEGLRYPVNTFTVKARDQNQNGTEETHSFGYGEVRPLATSGKRGLRFDPTEAMIPNAVSGFLPAPYLKGELKTLLLRVLNSDKFEEEIFPKLLVPQKLSEEVVQALRRNSDCPEMWSAHLARVIRLYNHSLGTIEIPRLDLVSGNKARLVLVINDFTADAEIFTIDVTDLTQEALNEVNTEEADSDGDGIPNRNDFPGRMVEDPLLHVEGILPVRLGVDKLSVHAEVLFGHNSDGELVFEINNIAGDQPGGGPLVHLCGKLENNAGDARAALIECRDEARTLIDGQPAPVLDAETCETFATFNSQIPSDRILSCASQNMDDQLRLTLQEMLHTQIPVQIPAELRRRARDPLGQARFEMFGKKLAMDLFADLLHAEVVVDPQGIFFTAAGLLAPAGVTEPDSTAPAAPAASLSTQDFITGLKSQYPDLVGPWFGPLREEEENPADPADAASYMNGELNLALAEEFLNSLTHSANTLLYGLSLENHDFLDLSSSKLLELGLAAKQVTKGGGKNGTSTVVRCLDQQGIDVEADGLGRNGKDDPTNNWKCFPFSLDFQTVMPDFIPGVANDSPVVIRTKLNPVAPLTLRILDVASSGSSTVTMKAEVGLRDAEMWLYEGEVVPGTTTVVPKDSCRNQLKEHPDCADLGDPTHEEVPLVKFKSSGRLTLKLTFLLANEGLVTVTGGLAGHDTPPEPVPGLGGQCQGAEDGRQCYGATTNDDGTTTVATPVYGLDKKATYLRLSIIENNTLTRDTGSAGIVAAFQSNVETLLANYLADDIRSIWIEVPLMAPIDDFCKRYPTVLRSLCGGRKAKKAAGFLDQLWKDLNLDEDFDIYGLLVDKLSLGLAGNPHWVGDPNLFFMVGNLHSEEDEKDDLERWQSFDDAPRHLLMGVEACLKEEKEEGDTCIAPIPETDEPETCGR